MKVEVRLFAQLRDKLPDAPVGRYTVEVDEGASLAALLDALDIPNEQAAMVLVNGTRAARTRPDREAQRLEAGDAIAIFPALAGG